MESYVVAVRREQRGVVPADWKDQVAAIPGVEPVGSTGSPDRLQVLADPAAAAAIEERLGRFLHVEKAIPHRPSS